MSDMFVEHLAIGAIFQHFSVKMTCCNRTSQAVLYHLVFVKLLYYLLKKEK